MNEIAFRAHALDGAMLYFHRASGTSVRVETPATRDVRRTAPRVVMFGITNACNLRCAFCSRDVDRASRWTVDTAAEMLEGLAAAGTLEVAFGGGEPYAFRGLGALVMRLRRTTDLALHVTTNGTLIDPAIELDQIRLSIYDDWRAAAQQLVGRRWGANVLVDDAVLERLPMLLDELARLGASDVSLLSYVGPDPERHLSRAGELTLAAVMRASPLPCRGSVCWGDRVPRLFGGDCGAGLDFVTLTSDRQLQSCSFQDTSIAVLSSRDVLDVWRARQLGAPSSRAGCMRSTRPTDNAGVRIFQGFSGNNSGECVLVARFDEIEGAEQLLAELIPGWVPDADYSAPWNELFARERVATPGHAHSETPDEMTTVGKTFLARKDSAPADAFPELRALAWKRGAFVAPGGIHVHGAMTALFAIRARDAEPLLARARAANATAIRHGDRVFGTLGTDTLRETKDVLERLAEDRPLAMELCAGPVAETQIAKRLARGTKGPANTPRLAVSFWNRSATKFAADVELPERRGLVLVEDIVRRKRLAVLGLRRGAYVTALEGDEVSVQAVFWPTPIPRTKGTKAPPTPEIDLAQLARAIDAVGVRGAKLTPSTWGQRVNVSVRTERPTPVLAALDALAKDSALELSLGVRDIDPLAKALRRLFAATS